MSGNQTSSFQNNSTKNIRPDTFTYQNERPKNETRFGNSSQNPEAGVNDGGNYNNKSRQQADNNKYESNGMGDVTRTSGPGPRENVQLATRRDRMSYYQPVYVQGGANVYPYPYANMDYVIVSEEDNSKTCSWPVCCAVFFCVLLLITAISLIVYYTLPSQQSTTSVSHDGNKTVITRVIYNADQPVYHHHHCIGCLYHHHYF